MKYLLAIVLCFFLVACAKPAPNILVDHGNFSFVKPALWTENVDSGLYTWRPINSSEKVTFFESRVPKNMTQNLEQLVDLGLTNLKQRYPDLTLISKAKQTHLGSFPAIEIQFTATLSQEKLTFTQIFAKPANKIYTLTYTCGVCNHFAEFLTIAKSINIRD